MLVLSRKASEKILIGDDVVIMVIRIGPNTVRLGINAPKDMNIVREELTGLEVEIEEESELTTEDTNAKQLTDDDPFPFGCHKGKRMQDVPAQYLDWLRGQKWLNKWPTVADYIERNAKVIAFELEQEAESFFVNLAMTTMAILKQTT